MPNHWDESGDLVIEERTLFRQVGFLGRSGTFYPMGERSKAITSEQEPAGYSPVYEQIATDHGEGWED